MTNAKAHIGVDEYSLSIHLMLTNDLCDGPVLVPSSLFETATLVFSSLVRTVCDGVRYMAHCVAPGHLLPMMIDEFAGVIGYWFRHG